MKKWPDYAVLTQRALILVYNPWSSVLISGEARKMKLILTIILVTLMPAAFGADCKVYGISDSPQKLNCTFKKSNLALTCKDGQYYLNTSRVNLAFHMEVEDGAVPLVFRATDMELTVVINTPTNIEAELEKSGTTITGTCR